MIGTLRHRYFSGTDHFPRHPPEVRARNLTRSSENALV